MSDDTRHASGWYSVLPTPEEPRRLKGEHKADWVVVGAGVTGLAAARRLGELDPNARILLIDEHQIGYGSSGRNAGFVIDTPHLTEHLNAEENRRITRLIVAGREHLENCVRKHVIECDWSPIGHLTAVVTAEREKHLNNTRKLLEDSENKYVWYDRSTLKTITGTGYYRAAILTPGTVLLNPAALCRGLGQSLPENVEVCEQTSVRRVEPGSPVRIECTDASVTTGNVLLTTNAFISRLGFLRRLVFPMIACASLSRPMTDEEQDTVGGSAEWGITGTTTMRRTLSNRMLVRYGTYYSNQFRLTDDQRQRLRKKHKEILLKRYPGLRTLQFEQTWAGVFCMTRNWASHFGSLDPGVFVSLGYCGVGLARGTISGRLLAEYAMGSESTLIDDVRTLSRPSLLPPQPFLGIGVRARTLWYGWKSRADA